MGNICDHIDKLATSLTGAVDGAQKSGIRHIRMYRSLRSMLPQFTVFLLLVLAVLLLASVLIDGEGNANLMFLVRISAVVPAVFLLNMLRVYFNELYVFKGHVICHHLGRISLNYTMPVVYYSDVREIVVRQGLLGRMLNYGDVSIGTAATKEADVHLRGIYNPRAVERFIEVMRRLRTDPNHDAQKSMETESRLPAGVTLS